MASFNLTANINARLNTSNVRAIANQLRSQLSVTAKVNIALANNTSANVSVLTKSLKTLNQELVGISKNSKDAEQALRSLGNAFQNINTQLSSNLKAQQALNNTANAAKNATTQMEQFGKQAGLAFRRFAGFTIATGAIAGLIRSINSATREAISFQRELVRISQVSGRSLNSLKSLTNEITRLSTSLGVSSAELLEISVTLTQAGLSAADTQRALEALAKSSLAPTFTDIRQTTEGAVAILAQFGLEAKDLEKALGSVNAVSAAFAVESDDIIAAVKRAGGAFASTSAGVTSGIDAFNEFIAVFTSVRATTRESAETIATGLRTIFTRIQRPGTIKFLRELGINLQDVEGKFVGPFEAVTRLSEGLARLDTRDPQFASIVEELGGFRQVGKVIPLLAQQETRLKALQVAQKGYNSLTKDAETAQQAWSVQITKVREEFVALVRDISDTTTFKAIVQLLIDMTRQFIQIADAIKPVIPLIAALGAIRGASALAQFSRGLFGKGGIRFHDGGYVGRQRFASGGDVRVRGLVPGGKGMKDDFPATLQEGEFVIRRKAVDAIGKENLDRMNKTGRMEFASGGRIISQKRVGAAIFQPFNDNIGVTPITVQPSESPAIEKPKNYVLVRESLGEDDQKKVVDIVEPSIINGLIRSTKSITGMDIPNNTAKQIFEVSNAPAVMGSIFEGIISASTTKGGKFDDTIDPNRPIDFTNGIGALQQTFKKLRSIKYIEAKYSADQAQPAKIKPKIVNQLNWEEGFANSKGELTDKAKKTLAQRGKKLDLETSKSKKTKGEKEAKDYLNQLRNRSKDQFLNDDEKIKAKTALETLKYSKGRIPGILNGIIGRRRAFNSGGKVPALLTRGEYVINRNAARSIGYGNLERLNYADKYNRGGIVRQKYGIGSFVKSVFKSVDPRRRRRLQELQTIRGYQATPEARVNQLRGLRDTAAERQLNTYSQKDASGMFLPRQRAVYPKVESKLNQQNETDFIQQKRREKANSELTVLGPPQAGGPAAAANVLGGGGDINSLLQEIANNTAVIASNTGDGSLGGGGGGDGGGLGLRNLLGNIVGGGKGLLGKIKNIPGALKASVAEKGILGTGKGLLTGTGKGLLSGGKGLLSGIGGLGKGVLGGAKNLIKGGSGAGIILSIAGTALGDKIGGKTGGAISGVSSGAATGAALGSIIPGLGTGFGAIAGGIIGGISGAFDAGKQEEVNKLMEKTAQAVEESTKGVAEGFAEFEKTGKTDKLKESLAQTADAAQAIFEQDVAQRSSLLSSIGGYLPTGLASTIGLIDDPETVAAERGQDIKSQLAEQGAIAESFLINQLSKGKSLEESVANLQGGGKVALASQIANEEELKQLGSATNEAQRSEVARNILLKQSNQELVETAAKEKARNDAIKAASQKLQESTLQLKNFENILADMSASITRASNAGSDYIKRNQALLGNGIITQTRENIFDNPRAYSNEELAAQAQNVVTGLGGTTENPLAREVLSGLSSVNDLTTRLPAELAKIAASGLEGGQQGKIEETINTEFSGIPEQIRQQLISSIQNEVSGENRQGEQLASFAENGARQLAEQFTKPFLELGKKYVDAQNQAISEYEQAVGQWIDLQKKSNAEFDAAVQQRIENRNNITSLDRNLTFGEMTEGFRVQQQTTAARSGAAGSDIGSVVNRLSVLDKQREELARQVAQQTAAGGVPSTALAEEQGRIDYQTSAAEDYLRQIVSNTSVTAAATQKIKEYESRRQSAREKVLELATDPQRRQEAARERLQAEFLQSGGQLRDSALAGGLRGAETASILNLKSPEEREREQNELFRRQFAAQEAYSIGGGIGSVQRIFEPTQEEIELRRNAEQFSDLQFGAANELANRTGNKGQTILDNAAARFESIQQSLSEQMERAAADLFLAGAAIPPKVEVGGAVSVNVNFNGGDALANMEASLRRYVGEQIDIALNKNLDPQQRIETGYGQNSAANQASTPNTSSPQSTANTPTPVRRNSRGRKI